MPSAAFHHPGVGGVSGSLASGTSVLVAGMLVGEVPAGGEVLARGMPASGVPPFVTGRPPLVAGELAFAVWADTVVASAARDCFATASG